MNLIDSCGWLEYFTEGPLADDYYVYLKKPSEIITPTIILYEVYKKIKKEKNEESALLAVAQIKETRLIPFSEYIALSAADLSLLHSLPMADAIIYATARMKKAKVVTSDPHFKKLDQVVYLEK
jgi:predicted nucleic acid-binding protein